MTDALASWRCYYSPIGPRVPENHFPNKYRNLRVIWAELMVRTTNNGPYKRSCGLCIWWNALNTRQVKMFVGKWTNSQETLWLEEFFGTYYIPKGISFTDGQR